MPLLTGLPGVGVMLATCFWTTLTRTLWSFLAGEHGELSQLLPVGKFIMSHNNSSVPVLFCLQSQLGLGSEPSKLSKLEPSGGSELALFLLVFMLPQWSTRTPRDTPILMGSRQSSRLLFALKRAGDAK